MMMHSTIDEILLNAQNSHEAIRKIYFLMKSECSFLTTTYITKHTSIKSRGYVSEVLNGKKILNQSFVKDFCKLLKLNNIQVPVLQSLVDLDHANDKNRSEKKSLLEKNRSALSIKNRIADGESDSNLFLSLEIYSYLSMQKKTISVNDVIQTFKMFAQQEVEISLGYLIRHRFVQQQKGMLSSIKESFMFVDSDNKQFAQDFLRHSLHRSIKAVDKWHNNTELAHLGSSIITTSQKKLREKIPQISSMLLNMQKDLDDEDADTLIHFNVQIYPSEIN